MNNLHDAVMSPQWRRLGAVVGAAAVIGSMSMAVGCGKSTDSTPPPASTTTSPSPTSTAPPSSTNPTEKDIDPSGGNLFTPEIKAPPAPLEPPGVHRHHEH